MIVNIAKGLLVVLCFLIVHHCIFCDCYESQRLDRNKLASNVVCLISESIHLLALNKMLLSHF